MHTHGPVSHENRKLIYPQSEQFEMMMCSAIQLGRANQRVAQLMARARGHSRTLRTVKKWSSSRKGLALIAQSQTAVHSQPPPKPSDSALLLLTATFLIGATSLLCAMGALCFAMKADAAQFQNDLYQATQPKRAANGAKIGGQNDTQDSKLMGQGPSN
jgi:hypothetical protein